MKEQWIMMFGREVAPQPSQPGVWRMKKGGYLVRGRAVDPRTKRLVTVKRVLRGVDALEAHRQLHNALDGVRQGRQQTTSFPTFGDYARGLFRRKISSGKIRSAKGREKWGYVLEHHLVPAFGAYLIDQITRLDISEWLASIGERIQRKDVSPRSANTWLSILRTIMGEAVVELDLERDPMRKVGLFDLAEHPTYTDEEPGSLLPDEVGAFLATVRQRHPEFFAMVALGFATGWRPSTLRALRRRGDSPDVLWSDGVILARRSNSLGIEVMETTKTKKRQRIALPEEMMDILREHVVELEEEERGRRPTSRSKSDLLFPGRTGRFLARSALDAPFKDVCTALELKKRITPKGMRRTFQDLCRAAEVRDIVTRAVSGHATQAMQEHYSTVGAEEMRAELAKMIDLAGFRAARLGGSIGGSMGTKKKKAS